MNQVLWPQSDLDGFNSRDGYYQASSVCARGHIESNSHDPIELRDLASKKCLTCGASLLYCCPKCSFRIKGGYFAPMVFAFTDPKVFPFCDNCGSAFPWASRHDRIFELENLLFESNHLEESDKLIIQDELRKLQNTDISQSEESRSWINVKRRAGALFMNPRVIDLLTGLTDAYIRKEIGI